MTYFRLFSDNCAEIQRLIGMNSYVSAVEYGENSEGLIYIRDLDLDRMYIIETSASTAEIFDN